MLVLYVVGGLAGHFEAGEQHTNLNAVRLPLAAHLVQLVGPQEGVQTLLVIHALLTVGKRARQRVALAGEVAQLAAKVTDGGLLIASKGGHGMVQHARTSGQELLR
jgi:hypothetical protein